MHGLVGFCFGDFHEQKTRKGDPYLPSQGEGGLGGGGSLDGSGVQDGEGHAREEHQIFLRISSEKNLKRAKKIAARRRKRNSITPTLAGEIQGGEPGALSTVASGIGKTGWGVARQ